MPTYEYRCKVCNYDFEIAQSFSDAALTECPQCGGVLRKVFGNVGISFKGSGFYKTDHGSRASSRATGASDNGNGSGDKTPASTAGESSSSPSTSDTTAKATTAA
jgi:putative FmdB family regulatory protein